MLSDQVQLHAVVREGPVGFRHLVGFFALANRRALIAGSIQDLGRKLLREGLSGASPGRVDDPAHGQGHPPFSRHFYGDLVGGATDAAGADFHHRTDILERLLEYVHGITAGFFLHDVQCSVHHAHGRALLAAAHNMMHKGLDENIVVTKIEWDDPLFWSSTTH